MSAHIQSLEGRTLFSSLGDLGSLGDLSKLANLGSLTKLLGSFGGKNGLSSDFISKYAKDLSSASGKTPSTKALASFNLSSKTAFSDQKLSGTDITSLEANYGSVLKSQGLSASLTKSLNGDFSTLLTSKLSAAQKQSFLNSFGGAAGSFGKIKI